MKTLVIADLDGTLCHPSPYCTSTYLALSLAEQHVQAQTDTFRHALLHAPTAPWVYKYGRLLYQGDFLLILTGRWFYQQQITYDWLKTHLALDLPTPACYVQFLNFHGFFDLCHKKTDLFLSCLVAKLYDQIVLFEDDAAICATVRKYQEPQIDVYQIINGCLPNAPRAESFEEAVEP